MKAVAIVTSEHRNLSKIFVDSHFSSGKVSPEWSLNQGFGTKKKCPFPLNRGVPSIKVSQRRGSTVFVSSLVGLSQFIPSFFPANSREGHVN